MEIFNMHKGREKRIRNHHVLNTQAEQFLTFFYFCFIYRLYCKHSFLFLVLMDNEADLSTFFNRGKINEMYRFLSEKFDDFWWMYTTK